MSKAIRHIEWTRALPQGFTIERKETSRWQLLSGAPPGKSSREQEWASLRLGVSELLLKRAVEVNPNIHDGYPVLRGTRITIAQMIGEVADGRSIAELAESFELDIDLLRGLFEGIAIQFDHSFLK